MPTATTVSDPRSLDQLVRWAGRATRRAAPGPLKQYARAVGLKGISRASRHANGDPHSPGARNLIYIRQLAEGEHTSPYPQIVEEIAVAKRAEYEGVDTDVLEARLRELIQGEHERERAQNEALMTAALSGDYSDVPEGVLSHADVLVELAVLAEEITDRKRKERVS